MKLNTSHNSEEIPFLLVSVGPHSAFLRAQKKNKISKIYFLHMGSYAHSSVSDRWGEEVRWSARAGVSTEVRDEWTSRNRKTRTAQLGSAHLQELFFLKSIQNARRSSYSPAHGLLFAWLCSLRCGAELTRMLPGKKNEDAPFYAQLQMGSECSSSVFALFLHKSKFFWNTIARGAKNPKCFHPKQH